jgi:glycosyltransferase involved in cell wall biosynthesis
MKLRILSLGVDQGVLKPDSAVAHRLMLYKDLVDGYVVLVPSTDYRSIKIADTIDSMGSGGRTKVAQLINLWRKGQEILRSNKFDLISVQDTSYVALVAYILAQRFGLPLEVQVHGFENNTGIRSIISSYIIKRASMIRTVSQRLKQELKTKYGVLNDNIYVVPIVRKIDCPPINRSSSEFRFITVGRLVPVKNQALQLAAFTEIVKEFPHARLWIVGDGPERIKLQVQAAKSPAGTVRFWGAQPDISSLLAQADAFVLTSNGEGWGMVVIEAACCKLPIVMTNVGCADEFIKSEENGLIIPVGSTDKLIEAMRLIITHDPLRRRLGLAAHESLSGLPSLEMGIVKIVETWTKMAQ